MNSDEIQPYIHMYSILPQTPLPSRLPYNIAQSSLHYTVGPGYFHDIIFFI